MAETCMRCHVAHEPAVECFDAQREITHRLLNVVGNEGQCRGCHAAIMWVKTKAGKPLPYDPTGIPHFATCSQADRFRKKEAATA